MPEGAQSPTSPRSWVPWVAAAHAAEQRRPLLYQLPGVHHTDAANVGPGEATERKMAGRGGAERGAHPQVRAGRACFCAGVRPARAPFLRRRPVGGGVPFLRRRPAQRAFPRSQRRAGTQRATGKTRSTAEVCGGASGLDDLERIFGAGAGLAGTASLVPPYAPFPSFPSHLLSLF